MSKKEKTSDNHEQGNSSLGVVSARFFDVGDYVQYSKYGAHEVIDYCDNHQEALLNYCGDWFFAPYSRIKPLPNVR